MNVYLTADQPLNFLKLLAHDLRWNLLVALGYSDYRVQELVRMLNQPPNLVSYHLRRLREHHLVSERRSSADSRDVYYTLDLDRMSQLYAATGQALHPALSSPDANSETQTEPNVKPPLRVLFLCTHNSARSQMAEGILRYYGGNQVEAFSTGNQPSHVRPEAVQTMKALSIDISHHRSKHLDEFIGQSFDYVITVCDQANETCPVFPGDPKRIHWSYPDPSVIEDPKTRLRTYEQIAQELTRRINFLLITAAKQKREKE
jgi:ArsR family transcriptional regulator, arsenate/arsenite/antimonite-responsive transcriptional repressor / arsenate reductase (thioredoxin)